MPVEAAGWDGMGLGFDGDSSCDGVASGGSTLQMSTGVDHDEYLVVPDEVIIPGCPCCRIGVFCVDVDPSRARSPTWGISVWLP